MCADVRANSAQVEWADLHMHSRASDGAYDPAYLMELAERRGLSMVALTDHDTVAGLSEASQAAGQLGIRFINGVELDAAHRRGTMHILGYGIDPTAPSLHAHLDAAQSARASRNLQILERLRSLGITIDESALLERRSISQLGRPHIADAMIRAGVVRDHTTAFRDYLGQHGAAWTAGSKLTSEAGISAIRDANGVAVLAHPFTLCCESDLELETIVARLAWEGLAGIEVWHPSNNAAKEQRLLRLARRFDLIATGGSDLHFVSDREKPGAGFGVRIDARIVDELLSRRGR